MARLGGKTCQQDVPVVENRRGARMKEEVTEPRGKRRGVRRTNDDDVEQLVTPPPGTDHRRKRRRIYEKSVNSLTIRQLFVKRRYNLRIDENEFRMSHQPLIALA